MAYPADIDFIQEHFRKMVKNRGTENRTDIEASGIMENYCELEQLLDTATY